MIARARSEDDEVALELIDESPTNPRKYFDEAELEELTASVRVHGVIQAVVLRLIVLAGVVTERYELVVGARRFRAAGRAGLQAIPARVLELSDKDVLELQVIENSQRADVHPLEEADAFQRLMDAGSSADSIAKAIGKSRSHVYGRLRLVGLAPEVREAYLQGVIDTAVALVLARLPTLLQVEAATQIAQHGPDSDQPWSFRRTMEYLEGDAFVELDGEQWDMSDVTLDHQAGACENCPKRGANIPELAARFANVCTDRACAEGKRPAYTQRRIVELQAQGVELLEGKTLEKIWPSDYYSVDQLAHGCGWISTARVCHNAMEPAPYRDLLKLAVMPPHAVAMHPSGRCAEFLKDSKLEQLEKKLLGFGIPMRPPAKKPPAKAKDARHQAAVAVNKHAGLEGGKNEKKRLLCHAVMERLAKAIEDDGAADRLVLRTIIQDLRDHGEFGTALERRGIKQGQGMNGLLDGLDERGMLALLAEDCAGRGLENHLVYGEALERHVDDVLVHFEINIDKVRAELEAPPAPLQLEAGSAPAKKRGRPAGSKNPPKAAAAAPAPAKKKPGPKPKMAAATKRAAKPAKVKKSTHKKGR